MSTGGYWFQMVGVMLLVNTANAARFVDAESVSVSSQYEVFLSLDGHYRHEAQGKDIEGSTFAMPVETSKGKLVKRLWWLASQGVSKEAFGGLKVKRPNGEMMDLERTKIYDAHQKMHPAALAVFDVTSEMREAGMYSVRGMPRPREGFCGWAMVSVYEDEKGASGKLFMVGGVSALKPGTVYDVEMNPKKQGLKPKDFVTHITTIGGHGMAGNGSANLLNGAAISGRDDWDGSQGKMWDVDTVDVSAYKIPAYPTLIWTIDPVLQWVYPVGAVIHVKGGE